MTRPIDFDVLLLDIEGTTTPISFVHEVLFPYARSEAEAWLTANWQTAEAQADVALLRTQATEDREAGVDMPSIPDSGSAEDQRAAVLAVIHRLMDDDRKVTGLKSLQGKIWVDGYVSGTLKASLFDDVLPAIRRLHAQQVPVHIYSSGSIAAQKLLFRHTTEGDVTPLLSGYFDTTVGSKKEAGSYAKIAQTVGVAAERILFLTDVVAEADAASAAGVQVAIMDRPGNVEQPTHSFLVLGDFVGLG